MRAFTLTLLLVLISNICFSQTTLFSEDFEGSSVKFRSYAAVNQVASWSSNSSLYKSGQKSYRGVVTFNDTLFLESNTFSTVGYTGVNLYFSQICKVGNLDKARLQYSLDSGRTWIYVNNAEYRGQSTFNQYAFNATSYPIWTASQPTLTPTNTWWMNEEFNISSIANVPHAKIRFVLTDGDFNGPSGNYGWLLDNVTIKGANCELDPPILTNATTITGDTSQTYPIQLAVDIFDSTGVQSAKVFYTVNGSALDSISLKNPLFDHWVGNFPLFNSGDTVCYYFQATDNTSCGNKIQLPSSQCYQFVVLFPTISCITPPVNTYPYIQSFSNLIRGVSDLAPNGWENETTDDRDWYVDTVLSGSYRPLTDNTGGGNQKYLYVDNTLTTTNSTANIISPCFDLKVNRDYLLEFYLHQWGYPNKSFNIDVFANNTWILNVLDSIVGNQGSNWNKRTINLSAYSGQTIKIRFRAKSLLTAGGGGMAVDDFRITEYPFANTSIESFITPIQPECITASFQDVSVVVVNNGVIQTDTIPMAYQVNTGPIIRDTLFGNIGYFGKQTFIFSQSALIDRNIKNEILAWTEVRNDYDPTNDTLKIALIENPIVSNYPYNNNFDHFVKSNGYPWYRGIMDPGVFYDGWHNEGSIFNTSNKQLNWVVYSGSTASGGTGPSQDQNSTGNGNYIYIESSPNGTRNDTLATLVSPCIDLTNKLKPILTFWYHMYGHYMGSLSLDVYSNGNWVLDVMPKLSGDKGDQWFKQTVDLSAFQNQAIVLRFRGALKDGLSYSDMAIDNLTITNDAIVDLALEKINISNFQACVPNPGQTVSFDIKNNSNLIIHDIPLAYTLNNGTIIRDTISGPLAIQATYSYTLPQSVSFLNNYNNQLKFWVEHHLDSIPTNDTLYQTITTNSLITQLPYFENFDSFTMGAKEMYNFGWENNLNLDLHNWWIHSDTTPTALTGPAGDHTSGNGKYFYIQSDGYKNTYSMLMSPCIDLTNALTPNLEFWYNMNGTDVGKLRVDLMNNGSYIRDIIPPIVGNQGAGWHSKSVSLAGYTGQVRVVFNGEVPFSSGTIRGDIAIDDVLISELPIGINEQGEEVKISAIYPNPTNGNAFININTMYSQKIVLTISDVRGRQVEQRTVDLIEGQQRLELMTNNYEKGVYIIQLSQTDRVTTRRLVVK
ncbi:T9SS type A sorting domain-containing protein [Acidiluteibacter ferrifornacis]|uniref:T9SS type A sorting domain-containing protein n=1 Tax=Acidiluteibacter ferrifornacis TaxID=2692424 RepID=A0A6N9NGX7_9FLAO|nr:T9SS type A sorting domain-containing protein [Acidiluteibacter ferrifornacis]NBG65089.1 T9SS type A sorting domain-containing protein [Acidiluteibacter ferrifornacis]